MLKSSRSRGSEPSAVVTDSTSKPGSSIAISILISAKAGNAPAHARPGTEGHRDAPGRRGRLGSADIRDRSISAKSARAAEARIDT